MTLYSAFGRAGEPALAVPEKFSWAAFLVPPLFALYHGLWLMLALTVLAIVALVALATVIGGGAAFWLYGLLALWCGFAAPDLRRFTLKKNWREDLPVAAPDADSATVLVMRRERGV
jgi:hypothetical protein